MVGRVVTYNVEWLSGAFVGLLMNNVAWAGFHFERTFILIFTFKGIEYFNKFLLVCRECRAYKKSMCVF